MVVRHRRIAAHGFAVAVALLINATLVVGGPQVLMPDDARGTEVRAAAQEFWTAVADCDAARAKLTFAGTERHGKLLDAYVLLFSAIGDVVKTVGAAGLRTTDMPFDPSAIREQARMQPARSLLILADDQAWLASSGSRVLGGTRLQRVEGRWKVTGLSRSSARSAQLRDEVALFVELFERFAAAIREKRVATPQQLKNLNDESFKRIEQAMLDLPWELPDEPPECDAVSADKIPAIAGAFELSQLIGHPLGSEEVRAAFESLPGLPIFSEAGSHAWIDSDETGVHLIFQEPPDFALTAVRLLAQPVEGSHAYRGRLPGGLSIGDTRGDVERKLGPPDGSHGSEFTRYGATYDQLGLAVEYDGNGARDARNRGIKVRSITLKKRLAGDEVAAGQPPPPKPRIAFRLIAEDDVDMLTNPQGEPAMLPVSRQVLLDESAIADVGTSVQADDPKRLDVRLTFTPQGAKQIEAITRANEGRQLAIVLDGRILVAPVIRGVMSREVVLNLGAEGTRQQAFEIVDRLHAAVNALPTSQPTPRDAKVQPPG